jgi:uncharacterized membrane protein YvlD (DUF360 family)
LFELGLGVIALAGAALVVIRERRHLEHRRESGNSEGKIAKRLRIAHLLLMWFMTTVAVFLAAAIVPGVSVGTFAHAAVAALLIGALNAVLPPLVAALRLPFTLPLGFVLVLLLDAVILLLASHIDSSSIKVDSLGWALLAALVITAVIVILQVILGTSEDDTHLLRVIIRVARRRGERITTDVPGILFLEIDGLALPVLQRAMGDGVAPNMARWLESDGYQLDEWETDLSSQTGASQAGILLGSNENVPAFRWVEKETGKVMSCASPPDCATIEHRLASGDGLLIGEGASRGNLFSGQADAAILTVSRMSAETHANPGYRSFLANGFNITRLLILFCWEVILEWVAAIEQRRRDVRPRGHRGGNYPFLRPALCVVVRDLIVFSVLSDMMRERPIVYATFSSYDEVAHHSGLERADTLDALQKLDQHFGRIERARRYAPRRTSSWCSPTTGRPRERPSSSETAMTCTNSWTLDLDPHEISGLGLRLSSLEPLDDEKARVRNHREGA